ncbi:MAG TPA: hypothetical protein VEQ10_18245 [Vicinamibacteria bacterium]|nr:hypothetical protein [Vicinamibacteria bacterium]
MPLAFTATARSQSASPSVLPSGQWGGDHVRLEVTGSSTTIEFDCAHGSVDGAWTLGSDGGFDGAGVYVQEHGGPVIVGQPEDTQPAQYSGRLDGARSPSPRTCRTGRASARSSPCRVRPGRVFECA